MGKEIAPIVQSSHVPYTPFLLLISFSCGMFVTVNGIKSVQYGLLKLTFNSDFLSFSLMSIF